MKPNIVALALASLLLIAPRPTPAQRSLTRADCELWLDKLQGEVSGVQVGGTEGASEHSALLDDLKKARREDAKPADALKQVGKFKKRAARLAAAGKVNQVEGQRLGNLSDTVSHCIKQVESR